MYCCSRRVPFSNKCCKHTHTPQCHVMYDYYYYDYPSWFRVDWDERPVQCRAGLARWKSPINTYTQRMHFIFYMMDFMQLFRIECEWCKWCVVLNCMPAIPRVTNCLYARWCCFMCIKGIANTKSKYIVPFHCVECNSVYEGLGRLKRTEQ